MGVMMLLNTDNTSNNSKVQNPLYSRQLTSSLQENTLLLKEIFLKDDTLRIRNIENSKVPLLKCSIIYIDGMVSNTYMSENIIKPIIEADLSASIQKDELLPKLLNQIIPSGDIKKSNDINEILNCITAGDTLVLVDGSSSLLIINSRDLKTRAISEPGSEKSIRGPKEGLTESLMINITLIRRIAKNPNLKFHFKKLGTDTNTTVCLCYIEGIVQDKILAEVISRLDAISINSIISTEYIQEFIDDAPLSPFETVGSTERPDVLVGKILEGRVGIMIDGSPFALTVPFLFIEYFQAAEDYYNNFIFMSFNRLLRIASFILSISIPALYLALLTYNQEMIPTNLLLSIYAARENVPLPTVIESILMILVFEVLREAGTRLPSDIGEAISIVGALVLGQAAVNARLVSAPMVIVVGLTGIVGLINVKVIGASIVVRFIFLILSSLLGVYGYLFGVIVLIVYLMSLRSFGVGYMNTIGSISSETIIDSAIRAPWWQLSLKEFKISIKGKIINRSRARK
jgi:spore germination protein KA